MSTFRIMAFQETGEEVCVENKIPSNQEAYARIPDHQENHPEWYHFTVEEELNRFEILRQIDPNEQDLY